MGTTVTVEIRDRVVPRRALKRAFGWLRWVDRTFSTYDAESEISRLDAGDLGLADAHPLVRRVLARCEALKAGTDGYFDAHAPLPGGVDPSGLVKGWAVDVAFAGLRRAGAQQLCIEAGGDVRVAGGPWRVGIRHPRQREQGSRRWSCSAAALWPPRVPTSAGPTWSIRTPGGHRSER